MPKESIIRKSVAIPTFLISNGVNVLGIALAEAILSRGARVIMLDSITPSKNKRVSHLLRNSHFALFNVDLDAGVPSNIKSVDYVIQVLLSDDTPDELAKDSVARAFGTKALLDFALSSEAKFLLVEPAFHFVSTEGSLDTIFSYAKHSDFLHSLVGDYVAKRSLDARIVRVAPLFGPRMSLDFPMGLHRLIRAVLNHDPLRLFGDGTEKYPYLYISDAVDGLLKALLYKRTSGRIFKLFPEDFYADLEIAFILRSMANADLRIVYMDEKLPLNVEVDTLTGERVPRWLPQTPLQEGLKSTLQAFGYSINEHAFKPAQLIDSRLNTSPARKVVRLGGASKSSSTSQKVKESLRSLISVTKSPAKAVSSIFSLIPQEVPNWFTAFAPVPSRTSSDKSPSKMPWLRVVILSVALFFTTFVLLPLGVTALSSLQALNALRSVPTDLSHLQSLESQESAQKAFVGFLRAKNALNVTRPFFRLVRKESTFIAMHDSLDSAVYFSGALYRVSKAVVPFSAVWEVLKPTSSEFFEPTDFDHALKELSYARHSLDLALATYSGVDTSAVPGFLQGPLQEFGSVLARLDSALHDGGIVLSSLAQLLGLSRPQHYLILFQNPMELRPTGGFIGSYALLTLDRGKINQLLIDDIYNPDGRLDEREVQVPVPEPIQTFLNEDSLRLRNANWSPDFPTSAKTIEDLFFRLNGSTFDGVFAMDLNFIRDLLDVTGPVFLATYDEEINSANLFERAQFHAEFDYKDGASDKRAFLTVLGGKLLERLFTLSDDQLPLLAQVLYKNLQARNLLLSLKDPVMSGFLHVHNWDGSIVQVPGDYVYVVNANLGGTKSDYLVRRSYDYEVSVDTRDGLLRSTLTLRFDHTGTDQSWPGGPYKDYLRVYVPLGSKFVQATLTKVSAEDISTTQVMSEDVKVTSELGKVYFAYPLELSPGESAQLEFRYDLPKSLALSKQDMHYALYWQKQPGLSGVPVHVDLRGPFGTSVSDYVPKMLGVSGNSATLDALLSRDIELSLLYK